MRSKKAVFLRICSFSLPQEPTWQWFKRLLTIIALTHGGSCDVYSVQVLRVCQNFPTASFTCTDCPAGWENDGSTKCSDNNECDVDNGGCDVRPHPLKRKVLPPLTRVAVALSWVCVTELINPTNLSGDKPEPRIHAHVKLKTVISRRNRSAFLAPELTSLTIIDITDDVATLAKSSSYNIRCVQALRVCQNSPAGSFTCADCPAGWANSGPSGCREIDECVDDTHNCDVPPRPKCCVCAKDSNRTGC